jgi:hypothetical protein
MARCFLVILDDFNATSPERFIPVMVKSEGSQGEESGLIG